MYFYSKNNLPCIFIVNIILNANFLQHLEKTTELEHLKYVHLGCLYSSK